MPICQKHLEANGLSSSLIVGDAENLPYDDDTFDFVYSFGVLHHTPDMEKAIDEVFRVLKPGGKCWIGLYNKNSWFYRCYLLPRYYRSGEYKSMTIEQRLSLIEYPNTNKDILVRLTTKRELKKIFSRFTNVRIKHRSLSKNDFLIGKKIISDKMVEKLQYLVGWFNIVQAEKV